MSDRKQFGALDLAKFVAAILIIVLHTGPFNSYSEILRFGFRSIITVVAVPFFFLTSGFLFCTKLNSLEEKDKSDYFKKYFKRLGLMYLLWSAVYFIFVAIDWATNGFGLMDVLDYIRDFFFKGSYSTIWFLPALMTAVTVVYFLRKKLSYEKIFVMAIPFYIIACFGSSYYGISEKLPVISDLYNVYFYIFDTIKNGILFGWIYVALGGVFSERKLESKPIKYLIFTGVFYVIMAGETVIQEYFNWSTNGVDTKFMLLPLTIYLFMFVLSLNIKSGPAFIWMRKHSLLLFLSQRIFLTLFDWFLEDTIFVQNSMIYFISILSLTLGFSVIFIKLSEKVKVLKKFY